MAGHTSMTMPVLKTTVSTTPILGPVVSGWSHFHDHVCIENNSKYYTYTGPVVSVQSHFHDHVCIENNRNCSALDEYDFQGQEVKEAGCQADRQTEVLCNLPLLSA